MKLARTLMLVAAAGGVAWALVAWPPRDAPAIAQSRANPGPAANPAVSKPSPDADSPIAVSKQQTEVETHVAASIADARREAAANDAVPAARAPRPAATKVSRARPTRTAPAASTTDPLDDPALLDAAREIEDGLLRDNALDAMAMSRALQPDAFAATLDAFTQQGFADPAAERMTDLLRGPFIVQLGEHGGRLDRFACGRVLCAARYRFPNGAPPGFEMPVSGAIRREQTPAGTVIYTIFSTDDRVDSVVVPRAGG